MKKVTCVKALTPLIFAISIIITALFAVTITGNFNTASAEDFYYGRDDCYACHPRNNSLAADPDLADTHHLLVLNTDGPICLTCHQLLRDTQTGQLYFPEVNCRVCHQTNKIHQVHNNAHHLSSLSNNCGKCHAASTVTIPLSDGTSPYVVSYSNTRLCGSCHRPPSDEVRRIINSDVSALPDSAGTNYVMTAFNDKLFDTTWKLERSSNKAVALKLNDEAGSLSEVYIRLYVNELVNGQQTLRIYPYKSDGNNIDTSAYITYTAQNLYWNKIDVTSLLPKMKGFGWVKFRVTNTMDLASVSEADFVARYKNTINADTAMYLKFKSTGAYSASNEGAYGEPTSDFTIAEELKDYKLALIPTYGYSVDKTKSMTSAIVMKLNFAPGKLEENEIKKAGIRIYTVMPSGAAAQTLRIFPYKADGKLIDTTSYVNSTITSTGWQEIDVTPLLSKMSGFGWVKFRLANTTAQVYVTEGMFSISRK